MLPGEDKIPDSDLSLGDTTLDNFSLTMVIFRDANQDTASHF